MTGLQRRLAIALADLEVEQHKLLLAQARLRLAELAGTRLGDWCAADRAIVAEAPRALRELRWHIRHLRHAIRVERRQRLLERLRRWLRWDRRRA